MLHGLLASLKASDLLAIISAYERIPLSVKGDGKSSVKVLLARKQKQFARSKRDTVIKPSDPRIKEKLARDGLSFASVLARGKRLFLLDNANLSCGGDALDVTDVMHPDYRDMAIRLTKDMGLRYCGADGPLVGNRDQCRPRHRQLFRFRQETESDCRSAIFECFKKHQQMN